MREVEKGFPSFLFFSFFSSPYPSFSLFVFVCPDYNLVEPNVLWPYSLGEEEVGATPSMVVNKTTKDQKTLDLLSQALKRKNQTPGIVLGEVVVVEGEVVVEEEEERWWWW